MNKLKPLSVGKQVLFTFGTLCAILLIIGGLVFFSLRSIERGNQLQQSRALNKLALIDDTAQDVGQMQAEALRQVLASDMGEIKRLDQGVRDIEKINARELADYQKLVDTEKEKKLYDRVMQARKAYWEQTQPVLALGLSNRDAEATELIISKQAPAYDEYLKAINELINYVETDAKETARAMTRFIFKIRTIGDVLAGVAILIAIGTGFAVAGVARRLKEDNNILQAEIKERKQAKEKLSWETAFLEAQVNSSLDGILVVDQQGRKILQNQRTADLLKMPQHIADDKDDEKQRRWVASRAKNPEQFVEKVAYLYSHPNESGRDETEFKDGTILDRYSAPVVGKDGKYYGRIWTFRDITGRKQAEEERKKMLRWQQGINLVQQSLLAPAPLEDKLRHITDSIVRLFGADFCRIWLIRPGDLCECGCVHAEVQEGPHLCRYRDRCLHLLASSGRYTHIDGKAHRRVPFGAYKIGRIASGEDHKFLTNDVTNDPRVHNHEWAHELGLVSFAGYQLRIPGAEALGVLALFAKHPMLPAEDALLDALSSALAQAIQQAQAAEALRRSETKFRTLYDSTSDAVMLLDEKGFFDCNPAALAVFGCATREELCSKHPADVSPPVQPDGTDSRTLAGQRIATAMEKGSHHFEWMHQRVGTGETFPADVLLSAMELDGKPVLQAGVRDITARKRSEEGLRVQSAALEAAANAIVITDHNGTIQSVNLAFTALTGYTAPEAVGQNPRLLKSGKHDDAFYRKLWQTISSGQVWSGEMTNRRKDGSLYVEEMTITPLRNADGVIARYIAIKQDITGRKELEAQMERLRVEHALILNSIGEGVHWVDVDGRIKFENPAAAKMLGYEVSELLGQPAHSTMHHTRADGAAYLQSECPIYATLKDGAVRRVTDEVFWRKDGSSFAVEYICTPIYDKNGRSGGSVVIFTDITARKRAEEALRASQQIIEEIINAIPVRVFWKDKNLVYLGCNAIFARDAGFADPKDIIGKDDYQMGWRDQAELYRGDDRQVIESGCSKLLIEEPQTTPAGETITLLSSKLPLRGSNGEISGVLGTYMDITARKRLEAQLFQSQKLETVGKLAGGVAHEFNSILTAIIGQSELILADLPDGHPLFQNAAGIRRAAERAATLTRQLLAYGRRAFLRPESLDLNQVMAGTEGMVRQLMGGDVDMRIVPAEGLRAVKADAGQIEQVIMNLAMNARDAMPNGGKLTLETANVSFDQERVGRDPELKPGDYVMLAITDTGTGMSAEVKARAFEPFFTTKGVGQGTGLGLSTCYGIIKQSGGHISVYSEPGRGTTFKIYLPQVELQTKIPLRRLDSPDLPRGTETILLVEDDPALREMAATLLRRLGYTVLAAANGIEALSLKPQRDSGHVDLLFTDVVMPHMSGKELSERVRALYPHTRTLFTSGYTENAIVHQGVLNPGVALLQKPFTPSALAHKLREVLDQPGAPKPDPAQKTSGFTKITDGVNTP